PRAPRRAPMGGAPLLEARSLSVRFARRGGLLRRIRGWHVAVDSVCLEMRRGEVLALVGESGCGKTTLAHAIARLQSTSAGEIRLADGLHLRQAVQMVFQDPGASLNPRLPVAVALTEPMRAHRIGENDAERLQHARELFVRVGLPPEALHRYPHEFSGGQRQRIAIARALATRPQLIICDEITSALDVSVQAGILRLLHELVARDQLSLLFITHNMGVVEWLADRVAVMHGGRIVEMGAAQDVLTHPGHPYTRRLLAAVTRL
ncbi:MAG: ABC transporter ATP-binding protein, partial [Rhodocyclaceae bacterium]|nr:ABC transporter ATP-binding protein [Rhodocyclaceae bacterium]